ncbi:hypothetical protein Clacol_001696 [Clathrus columnatus]|uniref:Vacuolar protein sorting-associated protein 52 homolog n=1 Tax=Clathrus columnatus TaxID=1419009 RepID=A0AAV5A421_9AGAM|nr:hypothetical protein Clacol_001696 [Clathrus columnatus]
MNQYHATTSNARDFVELHEQVEMSLSLLDSLDSFLSTFQHDLSAVSGQISSLQEKSRDIENRLKSRRKIERPLSDLISQISISPSLAEVILDTQVGEPWLTVIPEFAIRLDALKTRQRVRAVRALSEVAEGLRIVAATKLRAFFLTLFQPIRSNVSTNIQVLQSSIFLKFRPLYLFLQRHVTPIALEIQYTYITSARVFYETGFRRYIRSLSWLKSRTSERAEYITALDNTLEQSFDLKRLDYSRLDGPSVTLAHMVDDKNYKEPIEALFRSMLLVLMDNGSAEYAFISRFFDPNTPNANHSPIFDRDHNTEGAPTIIYPDALQQAKENETTSKEQLAVFEKIWKQIFDPVLDYCQSLLDNIPPVIPLLIITRLAECVLGEVQKRDCPPLETFLLGLRLKFWPIFQKIMNNQIESLKRMADNAGTAGFLSGKTGVKDETIHKARKPYLCESRRTVNHFLNSLMRLRTEINRLIVSQSSKVKDPGQAAAYQSNMFEILLQSLSNGPGPSIHSKAQTEMAFWREREEEARRRVVSTRR